MQILSSETFEVIYVQYDSPEERDSDLEIRELDGWNRYMGIGIRDFEMKKKLIVRYVRGKLKHIMNVY